MGRSAINREQTNNKINDALRSIADGRERTNLLNKIEQRSIAFLVQRIPPWISSDMLTILGFTGNLIVFLGLLLAKYVSIYFLLLGILGLMISWFGDSLDGRIAYYRHIPRKWHGFTLDLTVDWIGIIFIGLGFMIYIDQPWDLVVYAFIVLYGWSIILAILRYKITGKYSIDNGLLGPTEVRIGISAILILEVLLEGSIIFVGSIACVVLLVFNIVDFFRLLKQADARDVSEKNKEKEDV